MTHLCEPREREYTGVILTTTGVSYGMVDKEGGSTVWSELLNLTCHPIHNLGQHWLKVMRSHMMHPNTNGHLPCTDVSPVPEGGGRKGSGEVLYEPMP